MTEAFAPSSRPPGRLRWFGRVLMAFARRELTLFSRYRVGAVFRMLSFGFAVVSLYFFARFIGAAPNQHLDAYGGDYLAFGIVGLLAVELQQVGVSSLSYRIRMAQMLGSFEAELATPAPAWMVIGAAPVYEFGSAALRSAGYLVAGSWILGISFARAQPLSVALVVPVVLLAFISLGLLTAATTMLSRRSNPVAAVLGAASFFLSGVLYPVSVLPGWLQGVSRLLPLTHALEALRRALLTGASPAAMAPSLVALAAFAVVLTPVGLALFAHALRRARIDGSLVHH